MLPSFPIRMVDLQQQYAKIKPSVDAAMAAVIDSTQFIGGPAVKEFQSALETYLDVKHVIPCANGTDALQIAMMALGLQPGDEVIVPAFTYVATAEVIGLLRLKPIMVDVLPDTFNIDVTQVEQAITSKTKAIVPVHLFGQSADMEALMALAQKYGLYIIEDTAQAIGAHYTFPATGQIQSAGCIGDIGCTSFFPSKNLGCYGDGGAMMTNDATLAARLRSIANHGQSQQYYHEEIGVNSRLDALQAAILQVKLQHLDAYNTARQGAADFYDKALASVHHIVTPVRNKNATHVFHQYTLRVTNGERDALKAYLAEHQVPSMVYYPVPLYKQKAFAPYWTGGTLPITEQLCKEVISLPMHTELNESTQGYIVDQICAFFND